MWFLSCWVLDKCICDLLSLFILGAIKFHSLDRSLILWGLLLNFIKFACFVYWQHKHSPSLCDWPVLFPPIHDSSPGLAHVTHRHVLVSTQLNTRGKEASAAFQRSQPGPCSPLCDAALWVRASLASQTLHAVSSPPGDGWSPLASPSPCGGLETTFRQF